MPKIVAVSDLHGNLPETPECDILIIAGDSAPDYSLDYGHTRQLHWLNVEFRQWLEDQPAKHIVGIAGNHDFVMEHRRAFAALDLPWHYLLDSEVELEGVKFYGLPWVPNLRTWAFYGPQRILEMAYEAVPDDTDIVVSHGPPFGLLDGVGPLHVGTKEALPMLTRVRPRAFICGHIHEGFGKEIHEYSQTPIYNVSYVDEFYIPQHRFTVID